MKVQRRIKGQAVALALTWDGSRWPIRSLPPGARAFLGKGTAPSSKKLSQLFRDDQIDELRICWIPRLKGGDDVLSHPFATPDKKRIAFTPIKTMPFGDLLGIIYRRV
jgi:hypothetical protein